MRTIPAALQAHLDSVDTTTTRLIKVTLRSGVTYGLTMLDRTVTYDDGTGALDYVATNGFDPSAFAADTGYSVDNSEAYALVSDDIPGVTVEMVEAGELDDATWVCYLVNYEDLSMGHAVLDAGDLGEVRTRYGMLWIPELLSYAMRLRQPVGSVWSVRCRAIFGTPADSQTGCGVDTEPLWVSGEVLSVGAETNRTFTGDVVMGSAGAVEPVPGRVQWLTGANAGREFAVEELSADTSGEIVSLVETTGYPIAVGDTYRIRPDCGKRFLEDCIAIWDNGINFKGEPHIPVGDASQVQTPGAQLAGGGAFSGVVSDAIDDATDSSGPEPPVDSSGPVDGGDLWDNYPSMNAACHQGDSVKHILDSSRWEELSHKNVIIVQSFNATDARKTARKNAVNGIHAKNPNVRFLWYTMAQETVKTLGPLGNDSLEISYQLIHDPVKGNSNWLVHRVGQPGDAGRCESNFPATGPKTRWNCNMAILVAGNNSLGENYATALAKDWYTAYSTGVDFRPCIDGFWFDNFNARPPTMYQSNGAITVTDQDYNANGVADARADYSAGANAGGRFWAQGHLELIARWKAKFGTGMIVTGNIARIASDYLDGLGSPPTPITAHPFYHQLELPLIESTNLALGLHIGSSGYTFNGGGSVASFYRVYGIAEKMLVPDASSPNTGNKNAVLVHALCVNRTTPNANDFAYARFITGLTMLVSRGAMCVQQSAALPLSLDETLIECGNPLTTRTMGTLNDSNPGAVFPLRPADITVSGNTIHYALFEKCGWFVNTTSPTVGTYPSADPAVTFTLPTPPAGKKWQRYNCNTYENPNTERAMSGQDPAVNNGADVTTASLKRYHAIALRLVNA